jgi:hypothetical protein
MKKLKRRDAFRWAGVALALPALESVLVSGFAHAQTAAPKKRFLGCFFPNGSVMPGGVNGEWTYQASLAPMAAKGLQPNMIVTRGYRAQQADDIHWSGTGSFLSSTKVLSLSSGGPGERGAKSFDQYVADIGGTRIRSLHAGFNALSSWADSQDSRMSMQYVNCVAWANETTPISNTNNPMDMFTRVFGSGGGGTTAPDPQIAYLLKRKQSVLDGIRGQLKSFRNTISSADQLRMGAYEQGIFEIERELIANQQPPTSTTPTCDGTGAQVTTGSSYVQNMATMQKIIVKAFECNATCAATIMYCEGIGQLKIDSSVTRGFHDAAHNDEAGFRKHHMVIMNLWSDMAKELKDKGLLKDTVVVFGSNMSQRDHLAQNAPFVILSEGPELRLGQDLIGSTTPQTLSTNRVTADIFVDLFKHGINKTTFGDSTFASTGRASGILT